MSNSCQRCENEEVSSLAYNYPVFAGNNAEAIKKTGETIRKILGKYSVPQLIKLDKQFRQYTFLEWQIEWKKVKPDKIRSMFSDDEDYKYALMLGTFHPNGYYRQRCTYALADFAETLPVLLLRLNDWSGEVQKSAAAAVRKRISESSAEELLKSAYALEVLKKSKRREDWAIQESEKKIAVRLSEVMQQVKIYHILQYDFKIRRVVYKMLIDMKVLNIENLEWLLKKERHGNCKLILLQGILSDNECTTEQVDRYLHDRSSCVRMKAIQYKYSQINGAWDGLESMLLDKCHGVRELAAYILEKHEGMDIRSYYLRCLNDDGSATAITGLSEVGGKEDYRVLLPFLKTDSEKILRCTIEALGKFTDYDGYELYWNYLFDDRVSISKAAYESICNQAYHYGSKTLYREFVNCKTEHTGRYLLHLLYKENVWDSMIYLICLYDSPKAKNENSRILDVINKRNTYQSISQYQAKQIQQVLKKKKDVFPAKIAEQILFDFKYNIKTC